MVPVLVGLLAITPRVRRWLRKSMAEETKGSRLSLTPQPPFLDPISPVRSWIVMSWLAMSATVTIGTFLVIFEGRDSLAGRVVFSLALGGITGLGFLVNSKLSGGAWRLRYDEEGVHAVAGLKRRHLGWESIKNVSCQGHRLRISTLDDGSDLICRDLPPGPTRRVADQLVQCLETLQPLGERLPEDI